MVRAARKENMESTMAVFILASFTSAKVIERAAWFPVINRYSDSRFAKRDK